MQQHTFYKTTTEQVNAIRANDPRVLKALYLDNFKKVERYVLQNSGSEEQAKDIFQEAFITLWRNVQLDKFNPGSETAVEGYLYRIAKNKWLDYLRSGHHKKTEPIANSLELPEHFDVPDEESRYIFDVKQNFKLLGRNCKEVLTRFYYDRESLKAISDRFDWTEATTRNNKYRCLQRLRELLKNK